MGKHHDKRNLYYYCKNQIISKDNECTQRSGNPCLAWNCGACVLLNLQLAQYNPNSKMNNSIFNAETNSSQKHFERSACYTFAECYNCGDCNTCQRSGKPDDCQRGLLIFVVFSLCVNLFLLISICIACLSFQNIRIVAQSSQIFFTPQTALIDVFKLVYSQINYNLASTFERSQPSVENFVS